MATARSGPRCRCGAGPNVVGAFGLLQTVADALKYVVKEVVVPAGADRTVFMLAPMISPSCWR
jgi:NADH:ubiquinone oxidoreductase subunit H